MGFKAIAVAREVAEAQNLSAVEARLLELLAEYAHDDEEALEAWPSYQTLARYSRYSIRALMRASKSLEEYGIIKKTDRARENGGQTSNLYLLHLGNRTPLPPPEAPVDNSEQGADCHPPPASLSPPPCQPVTPRDSTLDLRKILKANPPLPPQGGPVDNSTKSQALSPLPLQGGAVDNSKKSQEPEAEQPIKEPDTNLTPPVKKPDSTCQKTRQHLSKNPTQVLSDNLVKPPPPSESSANVEVKRENKKLESLSPDAPTDGIVGTVASEDQDQRLPKREKSTTRNQEPETKQPIASRESTTGVSQGRRRKRQTSNRESFRRPASDTSGGDRQNINHPDYRLVRGQEVPEGFERRPTGRGAPEGRRRSRRSLTLHEREDEAQERKQALRNQAELAGILDHERDLEYGLT